MRQAATSPSFNQGLGTDASTPCPIAATNATTVRIPYQANPQPTQVIDATAFGLEAGTLLPQLYNEINSAGYSRLTVNMQQAVAAQAGLQRREDAFELVQNLEAIDVSMADQTIIDFETMTFPPVMHTTMSMRQAVTPPSSNQGLGTDASTPCPIAATHATTVHIPYQANPQPTQEIDATAFRLDAGTLLPQLYNEINSAGYSSLTVNMQQDVAAQAGLQRREDAFELVQNLEAIDVSIADQGTEHTLASMSLYYFAGGSPVVHNGAQARPSSNIPNSNDPVDESFLKSLHSERDEGKINPAHMVVRRYVLEMRRTKTSKKVFFQCRFCKHLPCVQRANQSTVSPQSIATLYRANIRFIMNHMPRCTHIPEEIKRRCDPKKSKLANACRTREYWRRSAMERGLRDREDGNGIVYRRRFKTTKKTFNLPWSLRKTHGNNPITTISEEEPEAPSPEPRSQL